MVRVVRVGVRVYQISSLHSLRFGQLLRWANKRIVNIMKVYIERVVVMIIKN